MIILSNPLIQERRNISNLSVSIQLLWSVGGTAGNDCPPFWRGNLGGELWYSLTSTRRRIIVLMNLAFWPKCIFHAPLDYGQS